MQQPRVARSRDQQPAETAAHGLATSQDSRRKIRPARFASQDSPLATAGAGWIIPTLRIGQRALPALASDAGVSLLSLGNLRHGQILRDVEIIDQGFSLYRVDGDGRLTFVESIRDDATLNLKHKTRWAFTQNGDGGLIMAASGKNDNGFSLFEMDLEPYLCDLIDEASPPIM